MSTDLDTYLNYMKNWDDPSKEMDQKIADVIAEHKLFLNLDKFDYDTAINSEFNTVIDLAKKLRDEEITLHVEMIAADAAAIASIESMGMGMLAFLAASGAAYFENKKIAATSKALHEEMEHLDTNIAKKITNPDVLNYVEKYKANNSHIAAIAGKGLSQKECRSFLFQFIGEIEKHSKTSDISIEKFRKFAASARRLHNSEEIEDVYNALDDLNLSDGTPEDIDEFMRKFISFKAPAIVEGGVQMLQGISLMILSRNGYPMAKVKASARKQLDISVEEGLMTEEEAAELLEEAISESAAKKMGSVGKFCAAVVIIVSVVDIFIQIYAIKDAIGQCNKMVDELNKTVKPGYIEFYKSIRESATEYKAAMEAAKKS